MTVSERTSFRASDRMDRAVLSSWWKHDHDMMCTCCLCDVIVGQARTWGEMMSQDTIMHAQLKALVDHNASDPRH